MARRRVGLLAAGLIAIAACYVLATGDRASAQDAPFVVTAFDASAWPQVQVTARLTDTAGQPITGLTPQDFSATVGNDPLPVSGLNTVSDPGIGIATVLTFDTSGSMIGPPMDQAKAAGQVLVNQLGPDDQVAIVAFSNGVSVVQDFTTDKNLAVQAINSLTPAGNTALYAAVDQSVQLAASAPHPRRAIVLLSDGLDFGGVSTVGRDASVTRVADSSVVFFAIALGDQTDPDYLSALAAAGRGQFRLAPTPGDLGALYEAAANAMRQQYVITLDAAALDPTDANGQALQIRALTGGQTLVADTTLTVPDEFLAPEATPQLPTVAPPVDVEPRPEPEPAPVAESDESGDFPVVPLIAAAAVAAGGGAMALMVLRRRRRTEAVAVAHEHITDERFGLEPTEVDAPPAEREADQWEYPTIERAAGDTPLAWLVTDDARVPLGERPMTVGFTEDCTVRLPNNGAFQIERARVWRRDGRYMLHNLSRMGGVTIAGRPVSWAVLENGDEILIGGVRLVFEENPPEPTN